MLNHYREESYLLKEFEEINNYMRVIFSIAITWYTFFMTANLFAINSFLSKTLEGKSIPPTYLLLMSFIFIFVNILALAACRLSTRHFCEREGRLVTIIEILKKSGRDKIMSSPLPLSFFTGVARLIIWSIVGALFFWVAFTIVSLL